MTVAIATPTTNCKHRNCELTSAVPHKGFRTLSDRKIEKNIQIFFT